MKLSLKQILPSGETKAVDLVMIHGTGANADMWRGQLGVLSDNGYRCFLPELRGHGESHEPGEDADIEAHITDILETVTADDCGIRFPAVFIGHSLGAMVSVEIAERRPELVQAVLAIGMPGKVLPPIAQAFRWFLDGPYHKIKGTTWHERLPWRERTLIHTNYHTLDQIVLNFRHLNYVERQLDVTCPVHFSVGRFDPVALAHYVQKMHELLPHSTLQVFEWAGHNCMDEQPTAFNRWLLEKIEKDSPALKLEEVLEPAPEAL